MILVNILWMEKRNEQTALGRLERVELRNAWNSESRDFTEVEEFVELKNIEDNPGFWTKYWTSEIEALPV